MISGKFFRRIASILVIALVLFVIQGFFKKRMLFMGSLPLLDGHMSPINAETSDYYKSLINYYNPELEWSMQGTKTSYDESMVVSQAALLVDAETGRVLYEKNADEQLKIASLVKIMTAVVALEHADLKKEIVVSTEAATIGENSMGISAGEVYTLEELLYGLLLNSGNDAAYAIAEGVAGDAETFVTWMNFKAKEIGLTNTYFADPSGLDDSTYSTAADLVRLSRYAIKSPDFRRFVKTVDIVLTSDSHKYLPLGNQTNLLTSYPGVRGIKTGYTEEAGLCLTTYAVNNDKELLGVVLNSIDRKGDMILMLDYGFSQYGITVEHHLLD